VCESVRAVFGIICDLFCAAPSRLIRCLLGSKVYFRTTTQPNEATLAVDDTLFSAQAEKVSVFKVVCLLSHSLMPISITPSS
jgi:hypothetical protein